MEPPTQANNRRRIPITHKSLTGRIKYPSGLTIFHQNMRGLSKKVERLNHFLKTLHPTFLILTEHGLSENNLQSVSVDGYKLITEFSRKDHKLGGVCLYVNEETDIEVEAVDTAKYCIELVLEVVAAKITVGKKTFYLIGVYRPPGGQSKQAIEMISCILDELQAETKSILLMGDINIDRLTDNAENQQFEEELLTFGITRLPLPETRITSTSRSSIDCICTNFPTATTKFSVHQAGLSDHTGQQCEILLKYKYSQPKISESRRNFSPQNLEYLKTELMKEDWSCVYDALDVEEMYKSFYARVRLNLDHTCPNKSTRLKQRPKNAVKNNEEAKTLKEDFLRAFHKYELTGTATDREEMNNKKKCYDLKLRDLKRNLAINKINRSNNKSKELWNIINSEKQNTNSNRASFQIEINNKLESDPLLIAEHLNEFFSEVAEKTLETNRKDLQNVQLPIANNFRMQTVETLNLSPTNKNEVIKIMKSLDTKLSCGLDEVPSKVIKYCAEQLAEPLTCVINKSFEQGIFPTALKHSKIYPKHKKGSLTKVENYRPISLISSFSKIIEKIVVKRMTEHLQNQNLITEHQHGFLKGRSTISALVKLVEYVTDQLEKNQLVAAVMLDYSKAFDCLGHDMITNKLAKLGIRGKSGDWIESYLEGRQQIVELQITENGKKTTIKSSEQPLKRGVPQGSVLGPFLFVLFTNDFPTTVSCNQVETIMYADDTTLLFNTGTAQELQTEIISSTNKTLQYCIQNDLAINPKKTTFINFSRRKDEIPKITDLLIEEETKLLGVIIDSDLSWDKHVSSLCKKLSSGVFVVRRMKWIGGLDTAKTAYYALVESHIRYGLTVWGGTTKQNLNKVLILQKKAIRALADLKPLEDCKEAFKELGILTVVGLYIHTVIIHAYQQKLDKGEDLHHYNTRRAKDYILPIHHTTQYSRKPSYTGCKLYNALPMSLKNLDLQDLKKKLQDWLLERPLYSVDEFFNKTKH